MVYGKFTYWLINKTYTSHTRFKRTKQAVASCLESIKFGGKGLNVGAGGSNYGPDIINLDIVFNKNIDICADATDLPFKDSTFSVVISQETLEHVVNYKKAVNEIHRVLRGGGVFYCQLPFIIGYHGIPGDFWRFTKAGIEELMLGCGFQVEKIGIAAGPAMGFYRIAVEFISIVFSRYLPSIYVYIKGITAVLLYPIQWLDVIIISADQADRIVASYYIIAKRK